MQLTAQALIDYDVNPAQCCTETETAVLANMKASSTFSMKFNQVQTNLIYMYAVISYS